jgi:arginine:ornithine antiporter/lysine permease
MTMADTDTATEVGTPQKLTFMTMTAMVVGSMVGAGVFSLPRRFATETGVAGALIAWVVAGVGMLMLAFVFQYLAVRRPDLDAGVYAYAKAGFGEYIGFFSAFGYWASACVGNVTYWVLIMSTIGAIAPALGEGDTVLAVALSSVGVWVFFYLVQRGVKDAAIINRVVTIAKLVPIIVFVGLALFALDPKVFADNWSGNADVLSVFAIFASVTIVSYGILPYSEIAQLRQPSMGGVLEAAYGTWGKVFVSVGLIISVLGAYLAWTLMAAEVLFVAAKDNDMPRFLAGTRRGDVPYPALLLSTILVQIVLVITYFSDDAFNFALDLTSALTLIPFLFAAAYALRLARGRTIAIAGLATVYTIFLLFAAGLKFVLISFIVYAPATVLFVMARREQGRRLFSPRELIILAVSVAGAILGIVALAAGWISI